MYKIKNWDKFQHYKPKNAKHQQKMTWYKMYGADILNDHIYMKLSITEKLFLREAWDLASQFDGTLPDLENCAFRLRQSENDLKKAYDNLCAKGFLLCSNGIDKVYTPNIKIRVKADVIKQKSEHFEKWWDCLPDSRKNNKKGCEEKWSSKKLDKISKNIIDWTNSMKSTKEWKEGYNPSPQTILNQERWNDKGNKSTELKGVL
jgi:hypothetical protein|tara:strand:- start:1695 stop:2306 length:612 start_codon:yes stop_codon:yes gene_type:complete